MEMPKDLWATRDAVIDYAHGNGAMPKDVNELYEWLFWNYDSKAPDNFFLTFKLSQLDISDEAVRSELSLSDGAKISDTERLKFAREQIHRFVNDFCEDAIGAHYFNIQKEDGKCTLVCCFGHSMGQSGIQPEWIGVFTDLSAFRKYVSLLGHFDCDFDPSLIEDVTILNAWR